MTFVFVSSKQLRVAHISFFFVVSADYLNLLTIAQCSTKLYMNSLEEP